jgi:glycosyltransferase involved in cell wall biosynthesis
MEVIPNGVDTSLFGGVPPVRKEGLAMVFVGRLVPQKGLDLLIAALSRIRDELGSWRLTVVGDGPMAAEYRAAASAAGIDARIDWRGWVELAELPGIYRAHNLFVLPSRFEGMPSVLIQAMAEGCAALSADVFGADELVADGETGRMFPIEDVDALANALRALADPDLLLDMGRKAIERARLFDSEVIADRYEQLYLRALDDQ